MSKKIIYLLLTAVLICAGCASSQKNGKVIKYSACDISAREISKSKKALVLIAAQNTFEGSVQILTFSSREGVSFDFVIEGGTAKTWSFMLPPGTYTLTNNTFEVNLAGRRGEISVEWPKPSFTVKEKDFVFLGKIHTSALVLEGIQTTVPATNVYEEPGAVRDLMQCYKQKTNRRLRLELINWFN